MEEEKLKLVSQLGKRCRWKARDCGRVTLIDYRCGLNSSPATFGEEERRWFSHSYRIFESPWPV